MAKKYSSRNKKIEPAPLTLTFAYQVPRQVDGNPGTSTNFIDLSQCASLVSRRFYRQGIQWAVGSMKMLTKPNLTAGSLNGTTTINKLPTTWVMSNAWEKSFRAWQKMNRESLEETESVRPKFLDFKIYADSDHHSAGIQQNLLPVSGAFVSATEGEWESSKYVYNSASNATVSVEAIAVGASFPGAGASGLDAVSLIEGYAASRGLPNILDPNAPADSADVGPTATPENWLGSLFTEGTTQDKKVIEDMITENNIAPYPFENDGVNNDTMYPGGANQLAGLQCHDVEFITGTTIGGSSMFKGGLFPCGLIKIIDENYDDQADRNVILQIDLVPGTHRGYLCEPMTEM